MLSIVQKPNSTISCFSCFHVTKLREAYSCADPAEARKRQQELLRYSRRIATTLKLDGVTAAREYKDAALLVMRWTNHGRPLAKATNNGVWKYMLSRKVRVSHLPQAGSLHVMELMIRFHISIEDGECSVERDLGTLAGFNDAHCNVNTALADDLMILRSDPVQVRDIAPELHTIGLARVSGSVLG